MQSVSSSNPSPCRISSGPSLWAARFGSAVERIALMLFPGRYVSYSCSVLMRLFTACDCCVPFGLEEGLQGFIAAVRMNFVICKINRAEPRRLRPVCQLSPDVTWSDNGFQHRRQYWRRCMFRLRPHCRLQTRLCSCCLRCPNSHTSRCRR